MSKLTNAFYIVVVLFFQIMTFLVSLYIISLQFSLPITSLFIFFDVLLILDVTAPCFFPQKWDKKIYYLKELHQLIGNSILLLVGCFIIYEYSSVLFDN